MHAYPRKIIVFRHAEPAVQPRDRGYQGLSALGQERAVYLRDFIPRNFGTPDYILAAAPVAQDLCAFLTVQPLRSSHHATVLDLTFEAAHAAALANAIANPWTLSFGETLAGKNVVVCWHHGTIPVLMKSLGAAPGKFPDPWPDDDYRSVYVLAQDNGKILMTHYEMLF